MSALTAWAISLWPRPCRASSSRAAGHADEATEAMRACSESVTEHVTSAVSVALAYVHLQRGDLQEAHAELKRAEAALRIGPDKLVEALACMVAAQRRLAEGRAIAAAEMIGRARQDWSPPGWLDLRLAVLESRAHVLAGDITAAVAAAERADPQSVPEAAAALAHAWLAAGDHQAARRSLDAVTAGRSGAPEGIGLAGWLVDAQLSYSTGDTRARSPITAARAAAGWAGAAEASFRHGAGLAAASAAT